MKLDMGPELEAFRAQVRAFLDEALTPELREAGRKFTNVWQEIRYAAWQKALHARGWGGVDWPERYGGTGWYGVPYELAQLEVGFNGPPLGPEDAMPILNTLLNNRMRTIAGGSSEAQRNIVAKAILGL